MLHTEKLTVKYGELTIVDGVDFEVSSGQWLMVVGPNGAGKSTLVNAVSQGVPYTGKVTFEGEDLSRLKPQQLARRLGVLMQNHHAGYSFTVEEVVRLGRYAYSKGIFSSMTDEDAEKIEAALAATGMGEMRRQNILTLSGGELQRTFLAQVLAQDPKLLILDEPANHLDLVYQRQVFGLIGDWMKRAGRAVVSVVHDLNLAKAYGTHAMLLNRGRRVAAGPVGEVLNRENLQSVYAMDVYAWMRDMLSQWQEPGQ